ncbi:MAG: winged helix-turn-helix domain-containing protein [Myxococcota bacterium]
MLGLTACRIDLLRGVVHRDGALATLTTREAELMRFLAEHPSRVVSRDELLAQVWGYTDAVVSRACDNTVRRLREKVESDAGHPDHILTVHGAGYRFEPTATGAESSPAAAPPPSRVVDLGPVRIDLTRRRVMDTSGAIHALNEAETAILALLDDAQGESVDRDALGAAVWGRAKARPRVASTVRGLRTKLEPEPSAPRFLVSTRGGYRLVVPQVVERVELVGRDELVAQVLAALGADRWVLLLGPAGVGKSSLARRAAASVAGAVVWVDLATASTPSEAAARVARALDVDVGGADPVARVAQALSDRGAPFVVLDNLEGLADGAAMIEPWLAAGPVVRLLGTSRRRVGAAAEVVIEVGPLDREPAIDLFVRRARAVSSTNRAIGEHRDAIGALVERLERMPLAIELAAARTAVLGVDDLVERLRIDLLSRPTGGDPRHRSLRTAILASLGMLGPARLGALHDLALFRSGFDLEDAVGVLGDDAVDLLQSLRDDSLVHADPQGRTLRFDVWQAVRELLDEVAPDPGRLTRHCRQLAQLGRDGFDALGRDGSRAALDRLRAPA